MCYECSRKMEKERLLHRRVRETVSLVKAPAYLEQMILKRTEEKQNRFTLFVKNFLSGKRLVPLAGIAATAAMVMLVYFFVVPGNVKKDDLLYLAESRYHDFMMQQLDLDIRSQNSDTIVEYLRKQTNTRVVLTAMKDGVSLLGAALSEIDGIKISQIFYILKPNRF